MNNDRRLNLSPIQEALACPSGEELQIPNGQAQFLRDVAQEVEAHLVQQGTGENQLTGKKEGQS